MEIKGNAVSKFFWVFVFCLGVSLNSHSKESSGITKHIVVNGESFAYIGDKSQSVRGRVSGSLRFSEKSLERGIVFVEAMNVVYFGVNQKAVTGISPKVKETSPLGFVVTQPDKQRLKYDKQSGRLYGELSGSISLDQFQELTSEKEQVDLHDEGMTMLPATLYVEMKLASLLDVPNRKSNQAVQTVKSETRLSLRARPLSALNLEKELKIDAHAGIRLEVDWFDRLKVARSLCIQPVRIGSFNIVWRPGFPFTNPIITVNYTGDGLSFGQPGVRNEWNKADIVFNTRDWKTIFNASYSTLTLSEMPSLRSEVNDDDCVEVFFVDRFDPQAMHGGGNTISGGTASAKVISSDENADFGVDLTHLAHEYGHVLTLKHPGSGFPNATSPNRIDASSGTLMCPSGFNNDNPQANSQWNKDSVSNPLLTFSFKLRGPGPDCQNDADCGAC